MIEIPSSEAMEQFGHRLQQAVWAEPECVIYLQGPLGAGKTTLVRGFLRALNHQGAVKSPTYTLVEPYQFADKAVYHFDLYRLVDSEELNLMGVADYFHAGAYCLIEWPEKAQGLIADPNLIIDIALQNTGRVIRVTAVDQRGEQIRHALGI